MSKKRSLLYPLFVDERYEASLKSITLVLQGETS